MERFLTILFTMAVGFCGLIGAIIFAASDKPVKQNQPKQEERVIGYFPEEIYVPNRIYFEDLNSRLARSSK
jgi:hypothetical protein